MSPTPNNRQLNYGAKRRCCEFILSEVEVAAPVISKNDRADRFFNNAFRILIIQPEKRIQLENVTPGTRKIWGGVSPWGGENPMESA